MDDFDSFKASREKMDVTARKMSERQWKQAYAAHLHARERVGSKETSTEGSEKKETKRRHSKTIKSGSARGSHRPSSVSALGALRQHVREQSAYADLRLIVDILAWIAIAIFVLLAVVSMFFYVSLPVALIALLWTVVQVICVVVARLLVQVLVDIPDIALYRAHRKSIPEEN